MAERVSVPFRGYVVVINGGNANDNLRNPIVSVPFRGYVVVIYDYGTLEEVPAEFPSPFGVM